MKNSLLRSAIAAAALVSMGAAQATMITFDAPMDTSNMAFAPLMTQADSLSTQGYVLAGWNTKAGSATNDLVGSLIDGANQSSMGCDGIQLVCPTNNATTYYASLNDGLPFLFREDGGSFQLTQFDAAFIAAAGDQVLSTSLLLRVYGFFADNTFLFEDIYLPGPAANGSYSFATYAMSANFASQSFAEIDFYGYACTTTTSCTRSQDKAQFALDNINVVPEPASWALVALGLIGSGALTRRARKAA